MPDRLVREAARFSDRVEALSKDAELMFWRLITVPDDYGIFYADAAQLRSAIWPKNRRGIRIADVARWRDELAQAGVIAQFETDGVRYIELLRFGQKLTHPRRRFPARPCQPDDPAQLKMSLDPPTGAPLVVSSKQKRSEEKGEKANGAKGAATPTPQKAAAFPEPHQIIERLKRDWPHIDVQDELRKAGEVKRRQGANGVDLAWFEKHWLPAIGPVVNFTDYARTQPAAAHLEPEPEAWRAMLNERFHDEDWAKTAQSYPWPDLPRNFRERISREMRKGA